MKTELLICRLLLVLTVPSIPSLGEAQETNHVAEKLEPVQSGAGSADNATTQFEAIKAKAEKGDADAQCQLGVIYKFGHGTPKNPAEAVKWYRRAANQTNAEAEYCLGLSYEYGIGVVKDPVESLRWYREAADHGYFWAQTRLGSAYRFGELGVAMDEAEAMKWTTKAALMMNSPAHLEQVKTSAEHGNPKSQSILASMYKSGEGVTNNTTEAIKWYLRAIENHIEDFDDFGFTPYDLANLYLNAEGVAENIPEAIKWFQKAIKAPNSLVVEDAALRLGAIYRRKEGSNKNSQEALKWYRVAAQRGNPLARSFVGEFYYSGRGIPQDYVEAFKWFRMAAEQNEAVAQFYLGVCYEGGKGTVKNQVEAVKWFRKAAEQNLSTAQYNLGLMCSKGEGMVKDYVEGYKWWLLAAAQGHEEAKKLIPALESMMTREQISEGQSLARDFKPREPPPAGTDLSSAGIAKTRPEASGTGFFITGDGFLVTNEHVVEGAAQIRLVTSAGLISAKVVQVDAANDLAMLKAEGRFAPLPILPSRSVKLGSTVATVGFPNIGLQGFAPKLTKGEVASLSGMQDDARYFQISVPVQPGNSGGALVDERGNVVGVVSARLSDLAALQTSGALPQNVNYAVKSSYLLSFLESVPDVANRLKEPESKERKFEDVVKSAEQAAVLVLVY